MALTAGAKKFLVLVAVTGVLGGGYYYAKNSGLLDKKAAVEEQQAAPIVEQKAEVSQPDNPPAAKPTPVKEVTEQAAPVVNPEPQEVPRTVQPVRKVDRAPHQDQSSDKAIKSLKSLNTL